MRCVGFLGFLGCFCSSGCWGFYIMNQPSLGIFLKHKFYFSDIGLFFFEQLRKNRNLSLNITCLIQKFNQNVQPCWRSFFKGHLSVTSVKPLKG